MTISVEVYSVARFNFRKSIFFFILPSVRMDLFGFFCRWFGSDFVWNFAFFFFSFLFLFLRGRGKIDPYKLVMSIF